MIIYKACFIYSTCYSENWILIWHIESKKTPTVQWYQRSQALFKVYDKQNTREDMNKAIPQIKFYLFHTERSRIVFQNYSLYSNCYNVYTKNRQKWDTFSRFRVAAPIKFIFCNQGNIYYPIVIVIDSH